MNKQHVKQRHDTKDMRQRGTWKERHGERVEKRKRLSQSLRMCLRDTLSLSGHKSHLLAWPRPAPEGSVDTPDKSGQVLEWLLRVKSKSQNRSQAK